MYGMVRCGRTVFVDMKESDKKVLITGVGPVASIGVGANALWDSLRAGRTNVIQRELPVDLGRTVSMPVASMPPMESIAQLGKHARFAAEQNCDGNRDLVYSMLAMELAIADAGLKFDAERNEIGLIQVFEAPGVESTVARLFALFTTPPPMGGPPPVYELLAPSFYNMQAFLYVHVAAKAFGLRGFCTSVHNACSSGAFAIELAAQRIRSGQAEAMIVAGGEAFDTAVRLEWFRRLDLYAKDAASMRPFDSTSSGFYVGEGGGAIVLESADHAAERGARGYAEYLGGGFGHQAWKQTIPDLRSGLLARIIKGALNQTDVEPHDVDLIVPHGASTALSDGYEAASLREFEWRKEARAGEAGCVATVFKPCVGHMLASCGLMETICALLAMKNRSVPPTPHSSGNNGSMPVPVLNSASGNQIKTMVKLFTGFTGHDAALLFRNASI